MTSKPIGDMALLHVIDDMRFGRHPAQQWEVDKQYWVIRTIVTYMMPSREIQKEAWAEFRALKLDGPATPRQRMEVEAVCQV